MSRTCNSDSVGHFENDSHSQVLSDRRSNAVFANELHWHFVYNELNQQLNENASHLHLMT